VITDIDVASVAKVDGYVHISENDALTSIAMADLVEVVGNYRAQTNGILSTVVTEVALPKLVTVGGYFWFDNNDALVSLALPALTNVGGNVRVRAAAALVAAAAPVCHSQLHHQSTPPLVHPPTQSLARLLVVCIPAACCQASVGATDARHRRAVAVSLLLLRARAYRTTQVRRNDKLVSVSVPVLASVVGSLQVEYQEVDPAATDKPVTVVYTCRPADPGWPPAIRCAKTPRPTDKYAPPN
jgi:hypothetical protein